MTTSSTAQSPSRLQLGGILDWMRSRSPREVGMMTLGTAVFMTLATYLLYTSLAYPTILLDPVTIAQATVAHAAVGGVIGFLSLLLSGGLVIAISINLASEPTQPEQQRILNTGRAAGTLWVVSGFIGLLLLPLWGHAPTGLTQSLATLVLVMAEIAAPALLALWTVALSRHLKANRILGWVSATGLLLGTVRSLVWGINALLPAASGFDVSAAVLSLLSVIGMSFWLLWLLFMGVRLLAQRIVGETGTTSGAGTMPRRGLLRAAVGLGMGIAGTAFVGVRTGFMIAGQPELEGDGIPAEPSLITSGYYLLALFFLRVVHPINTIAVLAQQTSPSDIAPPPQAETLAQLGVEVTIEPLTANGVPSERIRVPGASGNRWLLYLHGGGWAVPATNSHRAFVGRLSKELNATVLLPNYRLIPEHPFPAALDDCVAAYRWLRQQGVPASHIVVAGESAGANLTLTTTLALRENGDDLPAALAVFSPPTDMAMTGETYRTKAWADPLGGGGVTKDAFTIYTGHGTTNLRNPLVSPLYGDMHGFPPTLIQTGTQDVFLSDATRMADKLKAAGVTVQLEVWPGLYHAFTTGPSIIPESRLAERHAAKFMRHYLKG